MKIDKDLMKGSTTMLILNLLSGEDMYGYQMVKEIEKRSNKTFTLKEGTMYPILHSLESEGMVEAYWEESTSSRKRKYYHITGKGRKLLEEKKKEWEIYSNTVNKVIGGVCFE
ncbi:PadR family transcriptional regulator [Clostridium formicaceticum]|uniref:PadR family transcriptional regulator n=1 Tax=Clostridium formicaceticum TaxID=1497 RepID=A0AAC9WIU6_9CLOT|nr:helix-turn-helix transcriptional regulator [Clostridium formicaceticum]AOY74575.1 PadR family transcriptional regulator [Clostridium formicaceticum]ARE88935.1 Transcriptional regulator YqjI [Clostridium formicaceticum]